jgi:hypothetical protein
LLHVFLLPDSLYASSICSVVCSSTLSRFQSCNRTTRSRLIGNTGDPRFAWAKLTVDAIMCKHRVNTHASLSVLHWLITNNVPKEPGPTYAKNQTIALAAMWQGSAHLGYDIRARLQAFKEPIKPFPMRVVNCVGFT